MLISEAKAWRCDKSLAKGYPEPRGHSGNGWRKPVQLSQSTLYVLSVAWTDSQTVRLAILRRFVSLLHGFVFPANLADVCGFFFRSPPPYTPFPELESFLKAGPSPIYIGFGSIVMENPEHMTQTI